MCVLLCVYMQSTIQEKICQRETEVNHNQLRQRDVERFRNRQQFIVKIEHLKKKKCWLVRGPVNGQWEGVLIDECVSELILTMEQLKHGVVYGGVLVR